MSDQDMNDRKLQSLMRALATRDHNTPRFEEVTNAAARRWRIRPARVSIAAACLFALGLVAFEVRPGPAPPQIAELVLPPTTDWLLETPRSDWLARASQLENDGESDAN